MHASALQLLEHVEEVDYGSHKSCLGAIFQVWFCCDSSVHCGLWSAVCIHALLEYVLSHFRNLLIPYIARVELLLECVVGLFSLKTQTFCRGISVLNH